MSTHDAEVLYRGEQVLRTWCEHAYAEARRLVFDVIEGPLDRAALTPRQLAALDEFLDAEADLEALRHARHAQDEHWTS